jgi:cyclic pyranopterin phosphate synthase
MLTHLDKNNRPTMVDVADKRISVRTAIATTSVQLPVEFKELLNGKEINVKKGPVFQTAIIAGTMAVKKTHEIVPFCHQVPVEGCKINIDVDSDLLVTITCKVKTTFKTGVEMEALHGAMTAALTIYDMCKALSHDIVIKETRLVRKTGGKCTVLERPTYGLVLTGGKSERMQQDKALLNYKGRAHALYIHDVLKRHCNEVFISARPGQWKDTELDGIKTINDTIENGGPIGGLLSAFEFAPEANWIVAACDLVHFNDATIEDLLANINDEAIATCFKNPEKGFPEALCAFYTPDARKVFMDAIASDVRCPVKVLRHSNVHLVETRSGINLANINTKEEYLRVMNEIH